MTDAFVQVGAGKVGPMALNLTSRLQVTAHYFWNRRNAAALSHHGVRLEYDPEQRRSAALILGFTFTLLAVALMSSCRGSNRRARWGNRPSWPTATPARSMCSSTAGCTRR